MLLVKDGVKTYHRTCGYGGSPGTLNDEGYGCFTQDYEDSDGLQQMRVCSCEGDNCNSI